MEIADFIGAKGYLVSPSVKFIREYRPSWHPSMEEVKFKKNFTVKKIIPEEDEYGTYFEVDLDNFPLKIDAEWFIILELKGQMKSGIAGRSLKSALLFSLLDKREEAINAAANLPVLAPRPKKVGPQLYYLVE